MMPTLLSASSDLEDSMSDVSPDFSIDRAQSSLVLNRKVLAPGLSSL